MSSRRTAFFSYLQTVIPIRLPGKYLLSRFNSTQQSASSEPYRSSQEIPRMLSNPNVHYRLQPPPPPAAHYSDKTSSHISILLFKKHFNIIVQSMRRRSKSAPAFRGFQPKFCIRFLSFPSLSPALEYFIRTANTFHSYLIVSFPVWTFRLRLQQIYDTDFSRLYQSVNNHRFISVFLALHPGGLPWSVSTVTGYSVFLHTSIFRNGRTLCLPLMHVSLFSFSVPVPCGDQCNTFLHNLSSFSFQH
jgi:hypothetical protein